jgi:SSS family solute:Na+ symporter
MTTASLVTLALYFAAMLAIGVYCYHTASSGLSGYLLGGRQLSAKVTAISAGASDMSGWILMGLPGAIYIGGIANIWIAIGLVVGAYFNYRLVAPRLRLYSELANQAITLPDFFEQRFEDHSHKLRLVASLVIVLFFTLYTSSGMVAGGKLFESAFSLNYVGGLVVTTIVVVAYTLIGGFKAVSITDFFQGCLMLVALILVPLVVIFDLGGPVESVSTISQDYSQFLQLFLDADTGEALSIFGIISLLAWGLGYFGQPHILVRFMAIAKVEDLPTARKIGMSWMILSLLGACCVGLFGVVWIEQQGLELNDPETVFIYLSSVLFHPLISGFLLAAILAAIMSTLSSQLLVTSSSIACDMYQCIFAQHVSEQKLVLISRGTVCLVALVAAAIAWDQNNSVLSLVSNAWAGLGATFGPVILFCLFSRKMTATAALTSMAAGALTVILWISLPVTIGGQSLSGWLYEMVPGVLISFITLTFMTLNQPQKQQSVLDKYAEYMHKISKVNR